MAEGAGSRTARPTVLFVGSGEPMDEALVLAMERHGVDVERAEAESAAGAARAAAPDLVLLAGDAAEGAGAKVLAQLAASALTQVVPVALLATESALDTKLEAFRHGVVAVIPRTASADEIARRVASLARELPERAGEASGNLGEATLDDLLALVKRELKTGILSVEPKTASVTEGSGAFRLVLGAGKPVAKAVEEFVAQLRPLVSKAEPLRWEFHETAASRLHSIDPGGDHEDADVSVLQDLRVLLVVLDPVRADALATELRARGATVGVTDASGRGLDRARTLDPEVVVLDAAGLEGRGFEVVRAVRRDARLRWASMLVAHWDELWPEGAAAPDMKRIAGRIAPLVEPDRALTERARKEASFDTRLEVTGPSRLVRALVKAGRTMHVTVRNPRAVVELDIAEGLIVGVTATREDTHTDALVGTVGLAALLALASGRVRVEWRERPSVANVMSPVDEALSAGSAEAPPIPTSIPPPSLLGGLGGLTPSPPVLRSSLPPLAVADEPRGVVRAAATGPVPAEDAAPATAEATATPAFEDAPTGDRRPLDEAPAEPAPPPKRTAKATLIGVGLGPPTKPAVAKGPPPPRPPPAKPPAPFFPTPSAPLETEPTRPAIAASFEPPPPPLPMYAPSPPSSAAEPTPPVPTPPLGTAAPRPPPGHTPPLGSAARPPPGQTPPLGTAAARTIAVGTPPTPGRSPALGGPPPPPSTLGAPTPAYGMPSVGVTPSVDVAVSDGGAAPLHPDSFAPANHGRPMTLGAMSLDRAGMPSDRPLAADGFVIPSAGAVAEPAPLPTESTAIDVRLPQRSPLLIVGIGAGVVLLIAVGATAVAVVPRLLAHGPTPEVHVVSLGDGAHTPPPGAVDAGPTAILATGIDAGALAIVPVDAGLLAVVPTPLDAGLLVVVPTPVDAGLLAIVPTPVDAGAVAIVPATIDAGRIAVVPVVVDAGAPLALVVDAGAELADVDETAVDVEHRPANVTAANFLTIRAGPLVASGDLRDAEVLYLRALHEDPHNPHALAGLASLHLARHASRDALRYAQAAVAARPGRAAYRIILGDAFAQSGRRTDAVTQWREAVRLDPHNAAARQRLRGT